MSRNKVGAPGFSGVARAARPWHREGRGQKVPAAFKVSISAESGKEHITYLRRYLRQAHAMLRARLRELSVALVGDATMSRLHEQFMGLRGPTDVLSFELETDARGRVTAGEVIVCVPEARRQARQRGISLRHELLLYALHGMLHLCGFDDRTARDYRKMHKTEDIILTQLGVGPVFSRERRSDEATKRRREIRSPFVASSLRRFVAIPRGTHTRRGE